MSTYKTSKTKYSSTNFKNITEHHFSQICIEALKRVKKNKDIE